MRTGSIKTRINKGLSTDGICEMSMIAGWKLQMMAKFVFQHFLKNTVEVITLAAEMLNKHLDDLEEDHEAEIQDLEAQINKLAKRLDNLVEMRADGEISRDVFLQKKSDIETQINTLQNQLNSLKPNKAVVEDEQTHEQKIQILKYYLENSVESESVKLKSAISLKR